MSKFKSLAAKFKKVAGSTVLMLVFLLPLLLAGRWVYDVSGGVDPRQVYSQEELAAFSSEESNESSDSISPFKEGVVTVTFDDGWETIYSQGFELLEEYDIDTTQYILAGAFDDHLYFSKSQVMSMQSAGHEIGSHSLSHPNLTVLSGQQLDTEVKSSQEILSSDFGTIRHFASPLGAYNEKTIDKISKNYMSHRNTVADISEIDATDINLKRSFNIYNINAYTIEKSTTLRDLKKLIEFTRKRKGWLVLTYHQVDAGDASQYAVSPSTLKSHLNLIRKSELSTATMGEFLDAYDNQKERTR